MKTPDDIIRELMDACEYDPDPDDNDPDYEEKTSVDSLIAYKDALESAYAELLHQREPRGLSITFADEASESFANRVTEMTGYVVKLTTQDGETFDAKILGTGGEWHDAITYMPVDDDGEPMHSAQPRTVRVLDVYVY